MKLQLLILLLVGIALCAGALYFVWRSRPTIPCLPTGRQVELLNRSYRLILIFVLSGVLVALLCAVLSGDIRNTSIAYLGRYALGHAGTDSWGPMSKAIDQIRAHPDTPVYGELFFQNKTKFQYPPSALLFLDYPQRITGCSWEAIRNASNLICWLCVPGIGLVFYALLKSAALPASEEEHVRLPISSDARLMLVSLATVVVFYPVLRSFTLGQIQTALTLIAGLALLAWQRKRFGLAGFLIGICCAIKPQWIAIIPWAILRKQWKMVIAATITAGILLATSVAAYGARNVVDYLSVLSFLSRHGESYSPNQSMNGLMNRLLFNGNNVDWAGNSFPPFSPVVYAATLVTSIVILGVAMFWKLGKKPGSLDLALIMLSVTVASPIAWDHHYGILLPIFGLLLPAVFRSSSSIRMTTYLWIAFLLTSQTYNGITNRLANTHWNVFQSYLFFGGIMVLLLLYQISYFDDRLEVKSARTVP